MEISVVIPVYNAEKTLMRCIDSILKQEQRDLEIILVDDGSTDKTGKICDEYAVKDSRVRVFREPNGGVSKARNLGIKESKCKYITFIDADDYIERDYFPEICNLDYDLLVQNRRIIGGEDDGQRVPAQKVDKNHVEAFFKSFIHYHIFHEVCGKFYKRNILVNKNICFDSAYKFGEDTLFNVQYLRYVESINVLDTADYIYDQSGNVPFYEKYKIDYDTSLRYLKSFYREYLWLPYKNKELLAGVYDCFYAILFKSHYWIRNSSEEWNTNSVVFLIEYELGLLKGRKNKLKFELRNLLFKYGHIIIN